MTRQPNYSKQALVNAVYCAVLASPEPITRHEICRAIGRKKTPHIVHVIEELTAGGWLTRDAIEDAKFGAAYVYSAGRVPEVSSAEVDTET
jgi:predicted transcriptional regulator